MSPIRTPCVRRSATTSRPSSCSNRTSSARSRTSRRSPRSPARPARCSSSSATRSRWRRCGPPGDFDVDIAVGQGEPLGNRLDYGGPSFGFFAAQQAYLRRMPGRLVGATVDSTASAASCSPADARAAHPPREGDLQHLHHVRPVRPQGHRLRGPGMGAAASARSASCSTAKAHYAAARSAAIPGVELRSAQPFFKEFALELPKSPERVAKRAPRRTGSSPGCRSSASTDPTRTVCWWR